MYSISDICPKLCCYITILCKTTCGNSVHVPSGRMFWHWAPCLWHLQASIYGKLIFLQLQSLLRHPMYQYIWMRWPSSHMTWSLSMLLEWVVERRMGWWNLSDARVSTICDIASVSDDGPRESSSALNSTSTEARCTLSYGSSNCHNACNVSLCVHMHKHSLCRISHSELHWHPIHHILPTTHTGQGPQGSSLLYTVLQDRVLGYPCIGQQSTSVPST